MAETDSGIWVPGTSPSARDRARMSPIGLAHLATQGGVPYIARPVHRYLNQIFMLMAAAATNPTMESAYRRVIIAIPPRHGKSDIFSYFGPAWFMGAFPHLDVGVVSYEATFAEGFGRKARNVIEYLGPSIFGVGVDPRSAAADWWSTVDANNVKRTLGGTLRAFGIGGPAMGKGFNLFIIDDPIKNSQEALSKTVRDAHYDWFQTTAKTRFQPGAASAIVMQRWHEDDLAGRLMREEGLYEQGGAWTPIVLPLRAETITHQHVPGLIVPIPDPLGREDGEFLWPGRYTDKELEEKERTTPKFWWQAQYQQRPALPEGQLFTSDAMTYYDEINDQVRLLYKFAPSEFVPMAQLRKFITVDLAASLKQRADFTAFAVWGVAPNGRILLLELIHGKMEGPRQQQVLETLYDLHKPVSAVHVEKTAYQLTFVQQMRARGLPIREFDPKDHGDKYARALFASNRFEGEMILFPRGKRITKIVEEELFSYPFGMHDDIVDTVSMAAIITGAKSPLNIRILSEGSDWSRTGWTRDT